MTTDTSTFERSVTFSRGPSPRTMKILQYLVSHPRGKYVQKIADFVKAPYNSVLKTLLRLTEKGVLKHPERGFFMLNHEDPLKITTYLRKCHFGGGGVEMHGVGLVAEVPGLVDKMLRVGNLTPVDLRGGHHFRGESMVFKADLRLFPDSAYYQESCPPFPMDNVMLRYEDLLKSLAFQTRDLADVKAVWLNDYELGLDVPWNLLLWNYCKISRIIMYRQPGGVRIHVQFNKRRKPLPLDQDTKIFMNADLITALDEANQLLEKTFHTLLKQQTTHSPVTCNG